MTQLRRNTFKPDQLVMPANISDYREVQRISGISQLSPVMKVISVIDRGSQSQLVKVLHTLPNGDEASFELEGRLLDLAPDISKPISW